MARQPDESLGFDRRSQSQLESVPDSITAPLMEVDSDRTSFSDDSTEPSPEAVLRSLVSENGLVAILEAFNSFVETQVERLQDSSMQSYSKQLNAFKVVKENLTELIENLPAELDIELALTQVTHTAPAIEETSATLVDELI